MDSIIGWITALMLCIIGGVYFVRAVLTDYEDYMSNRSWEV